MICSAGLRSVVRGFSLNPCWHDPQRYVRGSSQSLHSSRIIPDTSHTAAVSAKIRAEVHSSLPLDDPSSNGDDINRRGDREEVEGSGRPPRPVSRAPKRRAQSEHGMDAHDTVGQKRRGVEGDDAGLSFDSAWDDDDEDDEEEEEEEEGEEEEEEENGLNEGTREAPVTASLEHQDMQRGQNVKSKHAPPPTAASLTQSQPAASGSDVVGRGQMKKPVPTPTLAAAAPRPVAVTTTARKASTAPPFNAMNDLEAAWAMSVDDDEDDGDEEEEEDVVDDAGLEEEASGAPPGSLASTAAPPAAREAQASTTLHARQSLLHPPVAAPGADGDAEGARPIPDFGDEDWRGNGSDDDDVGDANLCSDDNSGGGIEYF